jgi:prephenate dehydrogenase
MDNPLALDITRCPIGFVGLGLIGGSMALALKERTPDRTVLALDHDRDTLDFALKKGIIDRGSTEPSVLADAPLIVCAAPVSVILSWLATETRHLKKGTIILDTGSTKKTIVEAMQGLPAGLYGIGGHPMAGKETSGIRAAEKTLLEGAAFLLTPLPGAPQGVTDAMADFVRLLGARPFIVDAALHDFMVAATSHLPYLISVSLVNSLEELILGDLRMANFLAGGFRDTSRLAASSPDMTIGMCSTNRDAIVGHLRAFIEKAEHVARLLEEGRDPELLHELARAYMLRTSLYQGGRPWEAQDEGK